MASLSSNSVLHSRGQARVTRCLRLAGIVFVGLFVATAAFAQSPEPATGELLEPQGAVDVLRAGATAWLRTTNSVSLHPGDTVRTGPNSRAAIRLSNSSVVRMDERSLLQLRPAKNSDGLLLNLLKGASYFFHRERPVRTEFETPLVSGAVRGTEFHLRVNEAGRSELALLDGAINLTNEFGSLALSSGEQAIVEPLQPPRRTAMIEAANVIQWCLYYPAVLDPDELPLNRSERQALAPSLAFYQLGDLPAAITAYPELRNPESPSERIYLAALRLASGRLTEARELSKDIDASADQRFRALASALETLAAAVTQEPVEHLANNESTTSLLAKSYLWQSRSDLKAALRFALRAVELSPGFSFAWARVAELELSFGNTSEATEAIERALQLSPRNAQAHVVRGFLLASRQNTAGAMEAFRAAIEIDSALGNAWLGLGLCRFRQGDEAGGLNDLLVAAALEPNRAILRSYLGKAFQHIGDPAHASAELALARGLDPGDPTAWLYSALLNQQRNRINDAIGDLETSRGLNDNRGIQRSRFLLDQDQAVRRANLAALYRDAGMEEVGAREAARAVNDDYASHSAHLFLAGSHNVSRQPGQSSLRFETAIFNEYLLANLLAPPGSAPLSPQMTQQDHAWLFERDGPGITSSTEYRSSGDWLQNVSQFGALGNSGYAIDASYLGRNGQRPNNDLESLGVAAAFKSQLSDRDSIYLQTILTDFESGDLRQHYDPRSANRSLRIGDEQAANVFAGWHRAWNPRSRTLFLLGYLRDDFRSKDGDLQVLTVFKTNGVPASVAPPGFGFRQFDSRLRNEFTAWSGEMQHILQRGEHTIVAGARLQSGENRTRDDLTKLPGQLVNYPDAPNSVSTGLRRAAIYLYETWKMADTLSLMGGLTYDHLGYPRNIDLAPVSDRETDKSRLSPKLGLLWVPTKFSAARAAYTRSLGGLYYDNSVRLEPAQFAGFLQSYRSLIPDSLAGNVAGSEFETWSTELEHRFPTRTYLGLRGEWLESSASRHLGAFDVDVLNNPADAVAASVREHLDFRERSLLLTASQLLGRDWSLGLRYRVSEAELEQRLPEISTGVYAQAANHHRAVMHQLLMTANFNHPSGFYSEFQALWTTQSNFGYSPDQPGDDFLQFNVLAGWRLWRRHLDLTVGVLNLGNQDYRLNPLNLHGELPRERTLLAALRFSY